MKYIVNLNGKSYEVEVEKGEVSCQVVASAPVAMAPVATPVTQAAPAAAAPAMAQGSGEPVVAPIPGVVLNVAITVGKAVKKGELLFILEAMKMENEIFAPKDGTITSITVQKSASVDTGTVLCTIA